MLPEPNINNRFQRIFCFVTNDLTYDQRMQRICCSLAGAGYAVTLVGFSKTNSIPLSRLPFQQVRLTTKATAGKAFYAQVTLAIRGYIRTLASLHANERLALCAIDLDTLPGVWLGSRHLRAPILVHDAHELFVEQYEVKRRPLIRAAWNMAARWLIPRFRQGYTVNEFLAMRHRQWYGVSYHVVRNLPRRVVETGVSHHLPLPTKFLLYQGAVNEGRAFDTLIPAMKEIEIPLVIAGTGNYLGQVQKLVAHYGLETRVIMTGPLEPALLRSITPKAYLGLTLFDEAGENQYQSLANRFFDYIQGGIPQLCVGYPQYTALNHEYLVALTIPNVEVHTLVSGLNKLLTDHVLYSTLKRNTQRAASELCWENESYKLLDFWKKVE